jgi:dienelactone hydrolase
MAELLVFHHVHGRTAGVLAFDDELRAAGHVVHTPDLYDGRTFERLEDGLAFAHQIGFGELIARGRRIAEALPAALVYVGFSLGVLPAQQLAQIRPGARGALLLHACVPASDFGAWPAGVPAQIHAMDGDPSFVDEGDLAAARALVDSGAPAELFLYPGREHLFTDRSLAAYDAGAAALVMQRVRDFVAAR